MKKILTDQPEYIADPYREYLYHPRLAKAVDAAQLIRKAVGMLEDASDILWSLEHEAYDGEHMDNWLDEADNIAHGVYSAIQTELWDKVQSAESLAYSYEECLAEDEKEANEYEEEDEDEEEEDEDEDESDQDEYGNDLEDEEDE